MPELPEVEVVRRGLEPAVTGARVVAIEIRDPRSLKRHDARRGDFAGLMTGARLEAPRRRGKFLWIPLAIASTSSAPEALMIHLGMSGQVLLRDVGAPDETHVRVRLTLEMSDRRVVEARFVDQRIFGSMAVDEMVVGTGGLIPRQAAHIASDPLEDSFDLEALVRRLRTKHTGIKRALLDQTVVSGIGNIYADESLWRSRLHYGVACDALTTRKIRELFTHVRDVLDEALGEGGTSFDAQYVNVNGQAGYFEHSLNVYGRAGDPCPRCGTTLRRESFMNRGSHLCPRCQSPRVKKATTA